MQRSSKTAFDEREKDAAEFMDIGFAAKMEEVIALEEESLDRAIESLLRFDYPFRW